jgi:hypothetical protein
MHMSAIESTAVGSFRFAKGGGRQGSRNWCRCDQCKYAGGWCRQRQDPPVPDGRLISGTWLVENVLAELDQPGEYFFDPESRLLYLYPNETDSDDGGTNLRVALLETLIQILGAEDITIASLGFRDSAATYMGDWSAPSGGDWALHRGGAIFIEESDAITVEDCTFRQLDGNAVLLSQKTRRVTIRRNIFEWSGENATATWGATKDYDATWRKQPIGTVIEGNVMRELGI